MIKFFIGILKWCLNIDEVRSSHVLKTAIDGSPLVMFKDGGWGKGSSLYSTPKGIEGAIILNTISMDFNLYKIKAMAALSGKLDYCLTQENKDRINQVVTDIVIKQKGKFGSYGKPNRKDVIEIKTFQLTEEEIHIFKELIY